MHAGCWRVDPVLRVLGWCMGVMVWGGNGLRNRPDHGHTGSSCLGVRQPFCSGLSWCDSSLSLSPALGFGWRRHAHTLAPPFFTTSFCHAQVWNSHPKKFGPGSRSWYVVSPYPCLSAANTCHTLAYARVLCARV